MTIGEISKITEISAYTMRYYEKKGIIRVSRDNVGRRIYSENDVEWMTFIKRLKDTGMLLRDIKIYSDLRYQGDETVKVRMKLLIEHREFVLKEKLRWDECLEKLDTKIEFYRKKSEVR